MSNCLICNTQLIPFLDLGMQPSANRFLTKEMIEFKEYKYPLQVGFCNTCKMVQTLERPKKEDLFKDGYAYFTSSNLPMVKHFGDYADFVKKSFLDSNSFIIEIGSNDGVFLKHFKSYRHLGFEPSVNVANVARMEGVDCTNEFFDKKSVEQIVSVQGKADFIFAANVFGHVEEIKNILEGISLALTEKGRFVFEIYYLPEMLRRNTFDLIYDEHIFYYTLINLDNLFKRFNLNIFDVEYLPVHGGSIRGYVSHPNAYPRSERFLKELSREKSLALDTIQPLNNFSKQVEKIKISLRETVMDLKKQGKKIAGYGATAKSTTLLNYCDLGVSQIDFIIDSTPFKQGKFTPGKHIPILAESEFLKNRPDYTILFAWNYQDAIMAKQKTYTENGGKWILIHPEVTVI